MLGFDESLDADYRELLERVPAGVAIVRDGTLVYVNRTLLDWFQLPDRDAIVGKSVVELVHPDDREAAMARLAELDGAASTRPSREYRGLRADGTTIYLELASVLIAFDGGEATLLAARDVTEKRNIRAKLVSSERMASLGLLSAGIAHEINSPLTNVVFNLSCMAKTLERNSDGLSREDVERFAELVCAARDGASRVTAITRDLRAFARVDEERLVPVDVHGVLESAVNLARVELSQRARLVRDYNDIADVLATEAKLAQVFLNLLINAAHSFPDADTTTNEVILRTRQAANDTVVIEIGDTGRGIPEGELDRIFEPFFTTQPAGLGTGLGLWICRNIVRDIGGKIDVDSAPSKGTTFRISLPAAAKAS